MEDKKKKFISRNIYIIVGILIFIFFLGLYLVIFHSGLADNDTSWANLGSYIGVVTDNIFSFLTLVYVVRSFNQEKEEKEDAKEEVEEQKKEREKEKIQSDFLKSMELLNTCIENLSYIDFKSNKGQNDLYEYNHSIDN
jgi:uncharacterized membrane protein